MWRMVIAWVLLQGAAANAQSVVISADLRVPYATIQQSLEAAVPKRIDMTGAWTMNSNGTVGHKYVAERSNIVAFPMGNQIRIGMNVGYGIGICVRAKKPWPFSGYVCPQVASCQAQLAIEATVSPAWTTQWMLTGSASVAVRPLSACQLTVANIDATSLIANVVRSKLEPAVQNAVAQAWNGRALATQRWGQVSPRALAPGVWLAWDVISVQLGPIVTFPAELASRVDLALAGRIVHGPTASNGPLPPTVTVGFAAPPGSFAVNLHVGWVELVAIIAAGRASTSSGAAIAVTAISSSGPNVQLTVDITSAATDAPAATTTKVVKTSLAYDRGTGELSLSGLQLDNASTDEQALLAAVRPKLTLNLQALLQPKLTEIENALSTAGSPCAVGSARLDSVELTATGIAAAVLAPCPLTLSP